MSYADVEIGLMYFNIGFRAASSMSELDRIRNGGKANSLLISDAYRLVRDFQEYHDGNVVDLKRDEAFYHLVFDEGIGIEDIKKTLGTLEDAIDGKGVGINSLDAVIRFFNNLSERCLNLTHQTPAM
ncbi:hypothetical protein HYV89_03900 [Candidatus Woesearchaeota archaeon]|nr:hypothetical protein [Candidatus Woesearchaeota archaeon]